MHTSQIQQQFLSLRSNRKFEAFVIAIIILSAVLIGARTYDIPGYALDIIHLLDWFITLIFLLEISIRFLGEERKRDFFKNGWNIFDTVIVFASLIPIQDGEMALLGRLVRVFRVLRLVSIVPEMRILVNALVKALPQLFYVVILMFVIFYIYGAAGSMFFNLINPTLWGDVATAMLTLFRVMTFEDWTDVMYETMAVYPMSWTYYLTFIFFTTFAFLNMVIGIVVNTLHKENELEEGTDNASSKKELQRLEQKIDDIRLLIEDRLKPGR
ncbi:MAG: ion transporter [Gammaproteobacteria bacterium]|nr:ion transporter [Gammaproteobacteria bacterium]